MWEELLIAIVPYILTFLIGLILKSPYYQRPKKILAELAKALEDDKITKQELEQLLKVVKGK